MALDNLHATEMRRANDEASAVEVICEALSTHVRSTANCRAPNGGPIGSLPARQIAKGLKLKASFSNCLCWCCFEVK